MIHALCPKKYKIVTLNLKHSEKQGCCSPTPPQENKKGRLQFKMEIHEIEYRSTVEEKVKSCVSMLYVGERCIHY